MRVIVRFHRIASSRVCVRLAAACATPIARRRRAVFIARPAPRVGGARVVALGATGRARARSAAGVTWTSRTAKAPWAARHSHTSVVDAAGAIFVIGGDGNTVYNDVYASTDGGARAGLGRGVVGGVLEGLLEWVLRGYYVVLRGSIGVLRSTRGGTTGYLGYYRGTRRVLRG